MIAVQPDARTLSPQELAAAIQYTNVRPNLTRADLVKHVETAAAHGFDAAMVAMCWVPLAREILRGTNVKVATCFGLALGNESLHGKVMLMRECLALGADQVDYEPNMGFYNSGMYDEFRAEAAAMTAAAEGHVVKAMLEFGYLKTTEDKVRAVTLLEEGGLPWIKNSSGWGEGGIPATVEDIRLLRATVRPQTHVKASGKVNTWERAVEILNAGAELIGTSSGPQIMQRGEGSLSNY